MKNNTKNYISYTKESLSLKSKTLVSLLNILKLCFVIPVIHMGTKVVLSEVLNINEYSRFEFNNTYWLVLLGASLLFLIVNTLISNKDKFIDWEFLDDKIIITNKKNHEGIIENVYISKYLGLLLSNFAIILPFSLLFSILMSTLIAFPIGFLLENLIKSFIIYDLILFGIKYFIVIFIFKAMFKPLNIILIKKIRN